MEIPELGAGGPSARLVIPAAAGAAATLAITGSAARYGGAAPASLNGLMPGGLTGRAVEVRLASAEPADISLAYVHYVREALLDKGAAGVSVSETTANFTPVFSSGEWFTIDINGTATAKDLYSSYSNAAVYNNFDTVGGIEVMNGIKVFKHPSDNSKYMIAYNRQIKVSDLSLGLGTTYYNNMQYPFKGLGGLKKEGNGSISPVGNAPILIHGGKDDISNDHHVGIVDFATYASLLKELDLLPAQGGSIRPDNSSVSITGPGSDANVASNGIYDFILAYYNPKSTEPASSGASGDKALLPAWPSSGLAFDGSSIPAGVASRDIGGTAADSMSRKGARQTGGTPGSYVNAAGEPRSDFIGNMTVAMAQYMLSTLHVPEFKNTNIIGNADRWSESSIDGLVLSSTTNIGLIGDYDSIAVTLQNNKGVFDIKGSAPEGIGTVLSRQGYLNLWSGVSREAIVYGFYVVSAKGSGGEYIVGGNNSYPTSIPHVISYAHKYANDLSPGAAVQVPYHRAFVDSSGQVRIVDPGMTGIDDKYKGVNKAAAIPSLDEAAWIAAGNAGLDKPEPDLAPNYDSLPAQYTWADAADFNGSAVSAAPAAPPVRLAAAGHAALAALPAKRRPRFTEAPRA